jgi:beta-glucosidase-like glycosyl hydrolase
VVKNLVSKLAAFKLNLYRYAAGDALRAGLDQEMPGGDHFSGDHVRDERDEQKLLDQKHVDNAATHIVTAMEAVGVVGKGLDATGGIAVGLYKLNPVGP